MECILLSMFGCVEELKLPDISADVADPVFRTNKHVIFTNVAGFNDVAAASVWKGTCRICRNVVNSSNCFQS